MSKEEFAALFLRALNKAADTARGELPAPIPRAFLVELHAPDAPDVPMTVHEAVDRLYLGGDRFYRIVDVAVTKVLPGRTLAFVRVSGHAPVNFAQTWDAADLGPFKQISAEHVEDLRVRSG